MRGRLAAATGVVEIDNMIRVEDAQGVEPFGETFTRLSAVADATKKICWRSMKSRCAGSMDANCFAMALSFQIDSEPFVETEHDVEALHGLRRRPFAEIVEQSDEPHLLAQLVAEDKELQLVGAVEAFGSSVFSAAASSSVATETKRSPE